MCVTATSLWKKKKKTNQTPQTAWQKKHSCSILGQQTRKTLKLSVLVRGLDGKDLVTFKEPREREGVERTFVQPAKIYSNKGKKVTAA